MTDILNPTTRRMLIRDFGSCTLYNGTTAYARTASVLDLMNSANNTFTLSFWIHSGLLAGGRIFSEGNTNGIPTYDIMIDDSGNVRKLRLWVKNDANSTLRLTTTADEILNRQGWTHITWTDTNGTVRIYSDSILKNANVSYTRSGVFTNNRCQFGARSIGTPSAFYRGALDDVRIWKGIALSQNEITELYFRGVNPSTPTNWYKMDEASGTSLTDSGSANIGATLTNATFSTQSPYKPRGAATNRGAATGRALA